MAYVRTVKTASGATAAQIVWSSRRGSRSIEHIGSAHDEVELAALKAAAAERLAAGQAVLDLGVAGPPGSEPLPITSSHMTHLWEGLSCAYRVLGFESVTKGDNVFRDLVLARIIEPTSNVDAGRVLGEVGVEAPKNFDFEKARGALKKKLDEVRTHLQRHVSRYENEGFRAKADADTVAEVADKIQELQAQERILESQLGQLS